MAPYGVVALEEMDRACEKLRARQDEADRGKAWFEEWRALGEQIEKRGDEAVAKGRKITAGDYYLRAGIYHYNAERFILPGPEKKRAVRARLQGLAPGHQAASSEHRVHRGALRGHHPAGAVHEGAGTPARRRPWSSSTAWTTPRR